MDKIAMARATQAKARPKFHGRRLLRAKAKPKYPEGLAREMARVAAACSDLLAVAVARRMPAIRKAMGSCAEDAGARLDGAASDALKDIMDALSLAWGEFERKARSFGLQGKLANLAAMGRKLSVKAWRKACRDTLGVNVLDDYYMGGFYREAMRGWAASGASLIKSLPTSAHVKVRDIIYEGLASGSGGASIGRKIQEAFAMESRRARFIVRDQAAKLNASLSQSQQTDAGVEEYVWSTSKDQRVRESHAELEGKRASAPKRRRSPAGTCVCRPSRFRPSGCPTSTPGSRTLRGGSRKSRR